MKKQLLLFSSLMLVGAVVALNRPEVQAAEVLQPSALINQRAEMTENQFQIDGVVYEKLNTTEVKIVSHITNSLPETLTIPEKVKDEKTNTTYTVIDIFKGALQLALNETAKLKKVTLPNTIKNVGEQAFYKQSKLETVILGNSVKTIGINAFRDTTSLKNITLSNTLVSIDNSVFMASGIESIVIPDSVKTIGINAFRNTASLKNITLSNTLESIANSAFMASGIESIVIPDSVTKIEQLAFSDTPLTSVKLPSNLTTLSNSAFKGTKSLKGINIPDSVSKIEDSAFSESGLKEVRLPTGVTKSADIRPESFYGENIEKIIFTTAIESGIQPNVFMEPVRAGYEFDGWSGDNGGTYAHSDLSAVSMAGNITLTAKWKKSTTPQPSNGQSDANITLRATQPTGNLSFGDVKTDAKIVFNELTLNGKEQKTQENEKLTKAKVIVNDSRSDKTNGWKVTAKYADTNFSSKDMRLALKPTSTSTTGLKNVTLTNTELEVFNNGSKANSTYDVALKPELTIPADLTVASELKTQIQWTLEVDVP